MSKRSAERRITPASRTLRFLREQKKLSFRQASEKSGLNVAIINHLENGRLATHQRHLDRLLPCYGVTQHAYEMFVRGSVALPEDVRRECMEAIKALPISQLGSVLAILRAMAPSSQSERMHNE
jgi:transcriptional regulator with XRE-family HTH domain